MVGYFLRKYILQYNVKLFYMVLESCSIIYKFTSVYSTSGRLLFKEGMHKYPQEGRKDSGSGRKVDYGIKVIKI